MSTVRPFNTAVQLVERATNYVDLMIRDYPEASRFQLWAHRTLNDAYGDPTGSGVGGAKPVAFTTVNRGGAFRSPAVVKNKRGLVEDSRKGMCRIQFDPDDYAGSDPAFAPDSEFWFVRAQEYNTALAGFLVITGAVDTGDPILGPIYVVPTTAYFGMSHPALPLEGLAPMATGCVAGSVPAVDVTCQVPNPMHIVLPRYTKSVTILNRSGANTLLISTGLGVPMTAIGPTDDPMTVFGGVKELVVASAGGAVIPFSVHAVLAVGGGE